MLALIKKRRGGLRPKKNSYFCTSNFSVCNTTVLFNTLLGHNDRIILAPCDYRLSQCSLVFRLVRQQRLIPLCIHIHGHREFIHTLPVGSVVPPAAYLAMQKGDMNIFVVVLVATAGAMVGALINYVLALLIGRPIVYAFADSRFGHACLIDRAKVEKAEKYFDEHGAASTFFGRLIPLSVSSYLFRPVLPR